MSHRTAVTYEFGEFRLEASNHLLLRNGEVVSLPPKVIEMLLMLVEEHGQVVSKDDLLERLSPNTVIEEGNLTQYIYTLRRAFGQKSYIETVPKRGYRFAAEVKVIRGETLIVEEITTERLVVEEEVIVREIDESVLPVPPTPKVISSGRPWAVPLGWAIGMLAIAALAWAAWRISQFEKSATFPVKSIAILPFQSLDATQSENVSGLALADALITHLSGLTRITVRPTSAIRQYSTEKYDSLAAGRQLQVDAILEGSIQPAQPSGQTTTNRLRLTVRLLRVTDGQSLWTYKCDQAGGDLFAAQDAAVTRLADALAQWLGDGGQVAAHHKAVSPEALQLYLKGRWFWNKRTAEGFGKAIEHFERAIAVDPQYAQAYAGLADSYLLLGGYDVVAPQEAIPKAKEAIEQALNLDATLAEAHTTRALIAQNYERDWAKAEQAYQQALILNPNDATALAWYGEFLAWLGKPGEGYALMQRALSLDPLSLAFNKDAGVILFLARRYNDALAQYHTTLGLDPNFVEARRKLAEVYAVQGNHADALAEYRKAWDFEHDPKSLAGMGRIYAAMGRKDQARIVLRQLQQMAQTRHVQPLRIAIIHLALGEKEQAFAWLEREYTERGVGLMGLKADPVWDPLRADSRFENLLRRLKLN